MSLFSSSIINTKFLPPEVNKGSLKRPRILNHIANNPDKSLVIVLGPAGYGKSTCMAQWFEKVSDMGDKIVWLNLEESDDFPNHFLSYLLEAFKRIDRNLSVSIEELEELYELSDYPHIIGLLTEALAGKQKTYHVFFEDYHYISNERIHDIVQNLLLKSPENLKCYISSRVSPRLSLTKLEYRDKVIFVGSDLLAFDINEISQFFQDKNNLHISPKESELLRQRTGGWPATLQLISQRLKFHGNRIDFLVNFSGSLNVVSDFLENEVLSSLDEKALNFFLDLSVLDHFNIPLCRALTGHDQPEKILMGPASGCFLLQQFGEDGNWYRFHPLIKNFMHNQLVSNYPGREKFLHLSASEWFETNNYVYEAVSHALVVGDDKRSLGLLESKSMDLMEQGFIDKLISLVSKLPQGELIGCEKVLVPLAWAKLLSHRISDFNYLIDFIEEIVISNKKKDSYSLKVQYTVLNTVKALYLDYKVDAESELITWFETLPETLVLEKALIANVLSHSYMAQSQFDQAVRIQNQALPYQNRLKNPGARVFGLIIAGLARVQQVRLLDALDFFSEAEMITYEATVAGSDFRRIASLLRGAVEYQLGNIDVAEVLLKDNLGALRQYAFIDIQIFVLPVVVKLYQRKGFWQNAQQLLEQAINYTKERSTLRLDAFLLHEFVKLLIQGGNHAGAERKVAAWMDALEGDMQPSVAEWLDLVRARLLFSESRYEEAEALIIPLLDRFRSEGRPWYLLQVLLLESRIKFSMGDKAAAMDALMMALELDVDHKLVQVFLDELVSMEALLEQFIEHHKTGTVVFSEVSQCQAILDMLLQETIALSDDEKVKPEMKQLDALTPREVSVLVLVSEGLSNREVSEKLFLSIETVKSHLKSVYSKLDVSRRTQAVNKARDLNLV